MEELYLKVKSCRYDPIPKRYSVSLETVVEKCLKRREERITLDELLKHFSRRMVVQTPKRSHSTGSLLKSIEVPTSNKDVSSVLPASRYVKKQPVAHHLNP
jgi:hypothetical protein